MVIIQNAFVFCYTKESIDLMQFHNKKQREHDYFNELLQDKSAIKEIRSFFVFDWLENKRKDIYNNIESSHIKFSGKWTKTNIFWSSIMFLIEAMLLLFLVEQTRIGNIDVGQVILILQSNVLFVSSVSNMIDLASKLKQNDMYVEAFNEVSEYQKLEHRICKEASKDLLVNLKNIVFKYNDRIALNGIDFFMRKGEKIVILGENGSGKSTLVKIILGLLKEDSGIIMVNAEQKSAVFQDFSKFRFTVRENIGIGQQNYMIDDLKISTAIEDVGLHKLKKRLVRGYDTELGKEFFKDGLELSGGEWQKTAIARGIFKDTDLIIFDEPTAAIDPLSEKKQFEDLMDLCEEKGVIIVSHRVGVVHLADRVVFMKSGKIVCEGEKVAIVGENGSGKTTLLYLLLGIYEPTTGVVKIGKENLQNVLRDYRKKVSCLFQDYIKYQMSIEDNVFLNRQISKKYINKFVEKNDFIKNFPEMEKTMLGKINDLGIELSGGQWQKLAISRALVKPETKILIMDEPVASLDPKSENDLYENFDDICQKKSLILISHRLGVTRLCDKIIVMKEGRIIEQGSHNQLMAVKGEYYKMFTAQQQFYK